MKMKVRSIVAAMALVTSLGAFAQEEEKKPDPKFHIYLCFGQSNMAGGENPGPQDMENKAECLWKMATTDMPRQQLKVGDWYLTKPLEGRNISQLRLADFFGWTMLEDMPEGYRVGVINVSVPGCKIELFEEDTYAEYLKTAES
ncbi:MAG: sialate O-acetylesterase, partial [Lentisphaerae bacterium]|nr:sialate O-acetylesterase [Lentisphaerota bacterium]